MGFFGVKKRHPYPLGQLSYWAKAIIDLKVIEEIAIAIQLREV